MTNNNLTVPPRDVLTAFIRGWWPEPVIVSPIFTETIPRQQMGLAWDTPQDDPAMIEMKLRIGEWCGFPPIVKMESHRVGLLMWNIQQLERTDQRIRERWYFDTPMGPLEVVSVLTSSSGHAERQPIDIPDYLRKYIWVQKNLADYDHFRRKLRGVVQQIGERGLLCLGLGHAVHNTLPFDEELIYASVDEPKMLLEAVNARQEVLKKAVQIAAEEGVICFFDAQLSKNLYSPDMVRQWVLPWTQQMAGHCRACGGIYYLHECGTMQRNLDTGVYDQIAPDWLEGFEAPPLGDIADLSSARRRLPAGTVIKGNLNVQLLADSSPAQIEQAVLQLLEEVNGYRHIVGGACSLLAHTPLDNVRVMVNAVRRWLH